MKKLRNVFADFMCEMGLLDPKIVVMVGDISHGILQPFAKSCPNRYYNIGICEPTIVNMAAGIAMSGLIPIVHTIAPFIIERAYEQIKLDFGYQELGINLISVGSAFDYSQLGCSHHCYTDISLISHFKDASIFFPASEEEFKVLFKNSYNNGKINYFRLPENTHTFHFPTDKIKIGKSILFKEGKDLTVAVIGSHLKTVQDASVLLSEEGIEVEILYFPTIKPFDAESVVKSVSKTRKVLVVEECSSVGGVYSFVVDATKTLNGVEYSQIAIDDFIHSYGTYDELCSRLGFSVNGILKKVRQDFKFPSLYVTY